MTAAHTSAVTGNTVVPYWPLRASKLAVAGGCSALLFCRGLEQIRTSPPPPTALRGARANTTSLSLFPDDLHTAAMLLWFSALVGTSLVTNFCCKRGAKDGTPYWPLRAIRLASTAASCAIVCLTLLSYVHATPSSSVLRGTVANAPTHNELQPGRDFGHAMIMTLIIGLGATAVYSHMYLCRSGTTVPHWPVHALRLASAAAFCTLTLLGAFGKSPTSDESKAFVGGGLRGQRGLADENFTEPVAQVASKVSMAVLFKCVGAVVALFAFGSQVYGQAASLANLRNGIDDDLKKPKKLS